MSINSTILSANPTVCAVENYYLIAVPVKRKALMHIEIGEHKFYNHSNGIKISDTKIQMFKIPSEILNKYKEYTVIYQQVFLRFSFYCATGKEKSVTYKFRPIEKNENINICHIADCHGRRKSSSESGKYFNEDLDLLILNGDISHTCSMENQILLNYKIASDITGGHIPVIISRGNHDLRGKKAEKLEYMFPTSNGKSYYTVTIGNMWFLLLDCGEDKVDTHREYHSTVAFHPFREEQTLFLNDVIKKGKYNDDNIKYRFVISHIPFPIRNTESFKNDEKPFDIENEIYNEWCNIINEHIKPQLFISGHLHEIEVVDKADERNTRKICCDILIGSTPAGTDDFISANLTINSNNCSVVFNNKRRSIVKENSIEW